MLSETSSAVGLACVTDGPCRENQALCSFIYYLRIYMKSETLITLGHLEGISYNTSMLNRFTTPFLYFFELYDDHSGTTLCRL